MLAAVDHGAEIIGQVSFAVGDLGAGQLRDHSSAARPGPRVVYSAKGVSYGPLGILVRVAVLAVLGPVLRDCTRNDIRFLPAGQVPFCKCPITFGLGDRCAIGTLRSIPQFCVRARSFTVESRESRGSINLITEILNGYQVRLLVFVIGSPVSSALVNNPYRPGPHQTPGPVHASSPPLDSSQSLPPAR